MTITTLASLLAGALIGIGIGMLLMRAIATARSDAAVATATGALQAENSRLRAEAAAFDARLADLTAAQSRLTESFATLSGEALRQNSESFLQLAHGQLAQASQAARSDLELRERSFAELVTPIREGLTRYDARLAEIEKERALTFGALAQRIDLVTSASEQLSGETRRLAQALRAPTVRGRWGEIQLQRVAELAGMVDHCDFTTQESIATDSGQLRPDMTVRLPNGRAIVVDAKAPLMAYLESIEASSDEARRTALGQHARQIRAHVEALSRKSYWEQFGDASPEFVVLFIPGEMFFSAALEHDPSLIENAVEQRVIIATPTTLIALLKAVAFGWRQERMTRSAAEIAALGKELFDRLCTFGDHVNDIGRALDRAVGAYNKSVGSLEARVMVSARRFDEHAIGQPERLPRLEPVDEVARQVNLVS